MLSCTYQLVSDLRYGYQCSVVDIPGFGFHKALKAKKILLKILQTEIDNRRAMKKSDDQQTTKGGMLDLMMEPEESSRVLEDEEIIEVLLVLSFAGVSTPAHVATWSTMFLYQHPKVLQKAKQEEIIRKRPSAQKGLNFMEIKQMEYLPKVINEALRLFNIPFSNLRIAKADANINGYSVPKGWKVMLWSRAVHLDPEIYPAPKEYNPSRWDNHVAKSGSFIPFGGGARKCIGADMAKIEISTYLHHFLLNYKLVQLNPGCSIVQLPKPRPADNCLAKVIKLN